MKDFAKKNRCIVARGVERIRLAAGGPLTRRRLRSLEARRGMAAQSLAKKSTGKELATK